MTDEPSTHPAEPAAVDPLDERLSAALDGESAPAHREADDTSDARADERRRALEEARDLLAVPPPPLDDLTRRRILQAAVAERPHGATRDLTWLNRIGAAAAVLAVVVAGGLAINAIGHTSNDEKSSTAGDKAASRAVAPPESAPFDLHDVSDPKVLKERVSAALGAQDTNSSTAAPLTSAPQSTAPRAVNPNSNQDGSGVQCLSTITVAKGATPARVLADATYKGAPAIVAIAANDSGTGVYVVAKRDCRLLTYQFLKG